ncbi:hypothetical protein [Halohasta salina]|uniref:hypothetical protein n=1 Tax=Halohasta salina TaxID=2961621 RepID=UPI0020A3F599|nr:hypothetical protein [Halohasta salina]
MNRYVVRDTVVFLTLCLGGVAGLSAIAVVIRSTQLNRLLVDIQLAVVWTTGLVGLGLLWRYRSAGDADS